MPTNPFGQPSSKPSLVTENDEYDLKIRGLNKCFVESAQKLLERSPAADFSKLFQQYSKHLASFSVNLSEFSVSQKPEPEFTAFEPIVKPVVEPIVKPVTELFVKPVESTVMSVESTFKPIVEPIAKITFEPIAKTTFEPIVKSTFEPIAKPFEFKPIIPTVEVVQKEPEDIEVNEISSSESESEVKAETEATKLSFNFGSTAATAAFTEKPAEKAVESTEKAIESTEKAVEEIAEKETVAKPAFSFGAPSAAVAVTSEMPAFKPFTFGSSASATATATSNVTGSSSSSPAPFKSFSFGSKAETPSSSSGGGFSFGVTEKPVETPKFTFGSGSTPLPSFSFGAPSTTSGFSFTLPTTATATATTKNDQSDDGGDEIPAEEAESFNLTRINSEQLKTGAGEENETCQHEQRCKVFMMDPVGSWIDLGVGIFKINRYNTETGKSRVLCRSEGNGKVILNALVSVPGMNVSSTEGKKEVALLAVGPEGKLVKYLIRVKTLEQAGELKTAILNEIEYVKSNKA